MTKINEKEAGIGPFFKVSINLLYKKTLLAHSFAFKPVDHLLASPGVYDHNFLVRSEIIKWQNFLSMKFVIFKQ